MDLNKGFFRILLYASLVLLFLILFIFGLVQARHVLQPLVLSVLLTYLFAPLSNRINKTGLPFWVSNLLSALVLAGVFLLISILIFREIQQIADNIQEYKHKAQGNIDQLTIIINDNFGISQARQEKVFSSNIKEMLESGSEFMNSMYRGTANTVGKLLLLPVLVFYLMQMRKRINTFILLAAPTGKRHQTKMIFRKVTRMIERYVTGVFSVVAILMVVNSLGLWMVGMKYPVVFGIISAVLNLIPYFGNWVGGSLAIVFTLLTGDNPNTALYIFFLYLGIQFAEHNILTPNITGGLVKLNQIVTIMGLIAGGIIWGLTGMLVAIPFLATLKIILEQFEHTRPYAYLLGTGDHPLSLSKVRKIFIPRKLK